MGHRIVKRVPMNFGWPLKKVWPGYLTPDWLHEEQCQTCGGSGYSSRAQELHDQWYGNAPFNPSETGSTLLTTSTPEVRAFAERNVNRSPEFYGTGEEAIEREARRLVDHWNRQWCHHLEQVDVDALIAANRLYDLTHTWSKEERWKPRDPMPAITPADVNAWSLKGFGHDSINCWVAVEAKCEREDVPYTCATCDGHGGIEAWGGQREVADTYPSIEPPTGDGWQLWETTSEGSPVSPVFKSAEDLADWCGENATAFASLKMTSSEWLRSFLDGTTDADTLLIVRKEA